MNFVNTFLPLFQKSHHTILSFGKAVAGYPNENSNNRELKSARGTMGRGKGFLSSLLNVPLVISFFLLPPPPPPLHKETSAEETDHTIEVYICHHCGLEAVSAKMLNTVPLNKTKNNQYVTFDLAR